MSFVELLHIPSVGRSSLDPVDLSSSHLEMFSVAVLEGAAKHIFVSTAVARLMRATKVFDWLPKASVESVGPLGVLSRRGDKAVYSHLHFSVYGKFESRKKEEAAAIHRLLSEWKDCADR